MPYYAGRGDYYRGDYYRGDPGLLGNLAKGVVGGVKGFLSGGPLGALKGAAQGVGLIRAPAPALPMIAPPPIPVTRVPGLRGIGQRLLPGGETGYQIEPGTGLMVPCPMKGQRLNKSGYYKQIEKGNPFTAVYVPPKSVCVKSRRLNVANPRALRRAVRRAQGFAKLARRVLTFVSAKAPKGRAKFKKR